MAEGKPQIIIENYAGRHNTDPATLSRLEKTGGYKDQSTIIIIPAVRNIHPKIVQCWWSMAQPMNQKLTRIFAWNMEVGAAYSDTIQTILNHDDLKNWKYILTLETDNMPPWDGLLKLLEDMDKADIVGGLYWTKGEAGQPMIYGNPFEMPLNFRPQMPFPDTLQECNGLGMGFTLFKLDVFKDSRFEKPWFKTLQEGGKLYTQDLYFFERAKGLGYKIACDTRVKVGHYDEANDIVW